MQITFDPTNKREADYVLRMLAPDQPIISQDLQNRAEQYAEKLRISAEDNPETGAPAPGDTPLPPPVPSTAAADVFPIVPVAPGASIPPPPTVPPAPAPAAPPPAVAPTASPAAPSTHASGVQLDKNGLPHDARIHSEKPTITESGTWRKKRGLNDAAFVARVEAELRALMALPATGAPAAPSAAPLPAVPPVPPAPSAGTAVVPPPSATPAIPPAPPVPPAPDGASSPTIPPAPPVTLPASTPEQAPTTFAELMTMVTRNITQRKLTEDEVHVELRKVGLGDNDIGKLNLRMDLGAIVGQNLANLINSRGA